MFKILWYRDNEPDLFRKIVDNEPLGAIDLADLDLQRRFDRVSTSFGSIVIKEGIRNGSVVTLQPEFDSAQAAAELHDVPVRVVLDAARQAAAARDE